MSDFNLWKFARIPIGLVGDRRPEYAQGVGGLGGEPSDQTLSNSCGVNGLKWGILGLSIRWVMAIAE